MSDGLAIKAIFTAESVGTDARAACTQASNRYLPSVEDGAGSSCWERRSFSDKSEVMSPTHCRMWINAFRGSQRLRISSRDSRSVRPYYIDRVAPCTQNLSREIWKNQHSCPPAGSRPDFTLRVRLKGLGIMLQWLAAGVSEAIVSIPAQPKSLIPKSLIINQSLKPSLLCA